jgi:hypothetical protein
MTAHWLWRTTRIARTYSHGLAWNRYCCRSILHDDLRPRQAELGPTDRPACRAVMRPDGLIVFVFHLFAHVNGLFRTIMQVTISRVCELTAAAVATAAMLHDRDDAWTDGRQTDVIMLRCIAVSVYCNQMMTVYCRNFLVHGAIDAPLYRVRWVYA